MSWFYLALLAPFFFAVVTLIDDTLVRSVYKGPYFTSMVAGLAGALPLLSRIFLHADSIPIHIGLLALLAGFLTPVYYFFYFRALETESPSIVIAMFGLTPATLPFLAHFLLHEKLAAVQLVGFLIVLLASLSLAVTEVRKFKFSKALSLVLIGVVILDLISILTKHVYQQVDFYPAYLYYSAGMGIGGIYMLMLIYFSKSKDIFKGINKSLKKFFLLFLLAELFNLAAEFVGNLAVSRGPLSLVKVIEWTQPIYVLLIALALYPILPNYFREAAEGKIAKKLALMGVIIVGLMLINKA
jgi:drug/metabolite transporter (DMT)-like permease